MTDRLDRTPAQKRRRHLLTLLLALLLLGAGAAVSMVAGAVLGTSPASSASAMPSLSIASDRGAHIHLRARAAGHFGITGNLTAALQQGPGLAEPLNLLITNHRGRPLTVTDIRVRVSAVRRRAGAQGTCAQTGTDSPNFAVGNLPASYWVKVPARSAKALGSLGARREPTITWLDQAWPQNGCLGARLSFAYAASGWYR